ncbi:Integrase core domain-containing protein [Spirosoma endophyticum]|uniref:Integrase core domain-containing protein n=1 Tax=Spirosoma endophyticum TaxID=662367 RepID=A0A1I2FRW3_9BACT|nr:Integrase core domain-containing protein [Spirosoma endophyticum]
MAVNLSQSFWTSAGPPVRAYDNKVTLDFSRPGKPTDNAFIESFNGSFRQDRLCG